jgi:hypothetical protein
VAADGPRVNRAGEVEKVEEVRKIALEVDWPCEVKTLFHHENLGCQFGPRLGIEWFFQNEMQGIILEDDCLPSQSFFWFCEEMLDHFNADESFMAITGTNITQGLDFDADYFFSNYPLMWGWASWRRAWVKYDPNLTEWPKLRKSNWLNNLMIGGACFKKTWERIFDQTIQLGEGATWWDYQWIYSCWLNHGLTIAPAQNLIRNVGFSDDATHTYGHHPILSALNLNELKWPLNKPLSYKPYTEADSFISKHWFGISWTAVIKQFLLDYTFVKKINEFRKKHYEKNH